MPLAVCPSRVLYPNPPVVQVEACLLAIILNEAAHKSDLSLGIVLSAADIIPVESSIYRLLAAAEMLSELITVVVWEPPFCFKDLVAGYRTAMLADIRKLYAGHGRVGETKDISNVYNQKPAGLDALKMRCDDLAQHIPPIVV